MNILRKIRKNAKALSPVIASIILIAVTVAVSIAVAAWMGGMTVGFMGTAENLNVGNPWGWNANIVYLNVTNNGAQALTIQSVRIGSNVTSFTTQSHSDATTPGTFPLTLKPGEQAGLAIQTSTGNWNVGIPYTITLITQNNKEFSVVGTPAT
jgi:flagellin-like protein